MRLDRLMPERWVKLVHEAAKFGIVGGVNTVINLLVLNLLILTLLPDGPLKANVVATVVATTASYFMNRHWTYKDRPRSTMRREYALFFFFNAAGLAIELGVLGLTKYGLGLDSLVAINAAKLLGLALGTVFRFWAYRTFVFRAAVVVVRPAPDRSRPGAAPVAVTAADPPASFDALTAPLEREFVVLEEAEQAIEEAERAIRRPRAARRG